MSLIKDHMITIHRKILQTTTVHSKEFDNSIEETNEEWIEIDESTYSITRVNNH